MAHDDPVARLAELWDETDVLAQKMAAAARRRAALGRWSAVGRPFLLVGSVVLAGSLRVGHQALLAQLLHRARRG